MHRTLTRTLRGRFAPGDARALSVPLRSPDAVHPAVPVPPAGTAHLDTPLAAYAAVVLATNVLYGEAAAPAIIAQASCYFGQVAA